MNEHSPTGEPRRDRLVRAAAELFAEQGFHRATVPAIAARAGVSAGLLYRYFPSKTALAQAIVDADRDDTRAAIEELLRGEPDPAAAVRLLVHGWIDEALADRRACALVTEISAEATRSESVRHSVTEAERAIVEALARVLGRLRIDTDATALARLVLAALDGIVLRIAIDHDWDGDWDAHRAGDALVALLLGRHEDAR